MLYLAGGWGADGEKYRWQRNCYQARVSFPFQFPGIETFLEDSDQEPAIAVGASSLQTFTFGKMSNQKTFYMCNEHHFYLTLSFTMPTFPHISFICVCTRNCRLHDISLKKFQHVSPKKKDVHRHNHNTMAPYIIRIKISLVSFIADTIFSFF